MTTDEVKRMIETGIPGAKVTVRDLTGGGDHFAAEVEAASFAGKSMIEQHQMVYAAVKTDLGGRIHALQLSTRVRT